MEIPLFQGNRSVGEILFHLARLFGLVSYNDPLWMVKEHIVPHPTVRP